MTSTDTNKLLVLDANTPWIWSLFAALPDGWKADSCGPVSIGLSPRRWRAAVAAGHVPVPGWTRMFGISTALLARRVRAQLRSNRPRAIVHTIPWTAGLLDHFRDVPHVYRPHDFFGMYSWNRRRVDELEGQLVAECRLVVPISEAQAADFRKLVSAPIRVLPNGVVASFVKEFRGPASPRPNDLPSDDRPIIGCTGQISAAYNVELMSDVADALPDVNFIYIGPIHEPGFDAVMSRPNVRWLGPRSHDQLPQYLRHFSVCFSPLRMSAFNDRRSLLRLYDYLAAEKPILSTAIACAAEHRPHVEVVRSAEDVVEGYRRFASMDFHVDLQKRRAYVDDQTWNRRGQELVTSVNEFCS